MKTEPLKNNDPVALTKRGKEVVDPTPSRTSVRRQKMVSLSDQMRQTVIQMRYEAVQAEADSEEDDLDFHIEDDEPRSPHELFVESPEYGYLLDDIAEFAQNKKTAEKTPTPESLKTAEPQKEPPAAPDPEKGKK